jgi:hypothetical protein
MGAFLFRTGLVKWKGITKSSSGELASPGSGFQKHHTGEYLYVTIHPI